MPGTKATKHRQQTSSDRDEFYRELAAVGRSRFPFFVAGGDLPIYPDLSLEMALYRRGHQYVAGLDEAGRGSWAGPVVAAAVVLPIDRADLQEILVEVRDSKLLSAKQREELFPLIHAIALGVSVGIVPPRFIDQHGIVPATREAMRRAVHDLPLSPSYLLIDALRLPDISLPQEAVPKADLRHTSVAAASIIAKVARDRIMVDMDRLYPGYSFASHKGYGTPQHRAALVSLGACEIHRLSYAPMRCLGV